MASTPGLGTGLYTTANPSFFRAEDFIVDDSALDNALSEDEDGPDSLNLVDQLSKIDTAPPTDVPPREGLYSTPLSWEKPQPGLQSDPLLSSFNPGSPLLSDMEQQNLLAIALNTNRPPPANFGPGFGTGYGFGYGYDALGGGFPSLGANALMESLGSTSLNGFSRSAEQPRPTSQPRTQPALEPQASMQVHAQNAPTQPQDLLSSQFQPRQPQAAPNQEPQQRQQAEQAQGPSSRPRQRPPKPQSPALEQIPSAALPQQGHPSQPHGVVHGPDQPPESAVAAKEKDASGQEATADADDKSKEKAKPGDRMAHNDIERKYRTNLKDRISELRDSVPALRAIPEEGHEEEGEGTASQRLPKVSKVGTGPLYAWPIMSC